MQKPSKISQADRTLGKLLVPRQLERSRNLVQTALCWGVDLGLWVRGAVMTNCGAMRCTGPRTVHPESIGPVRGCSAGTSDPDVIGTAPELFALTHQLPRPKRRDGMVLILQILASAQKIAVLRRSHIQSIYPRFLNRINLVAVRSHRTRCARTRTTTSHGAHFHFRSVRRFRLASYFSI